GEQQSRQGRVVSWVLRLPSIRRRHVVVEESGAELEYAHGRQEERCSAVLFWLSFSVSQSNPSSPRICRPGRTRRAVSRRGCRSRAATATRRTSISRLISRSA